MFLKENNNSKLGQFINNKKLNNQIIEEDNYIISYGNDKMENYNNTLLDSVELDIIKDKLYSYLDDKNSTEYVNNSRLMSSFIACITG